MQVDSIANAVAGMTGGMKPGISGAGAETIGAQAPFAGMLKSAIENVQNLEGQAAGAVEGLMTGRGVDVHQAMIATEKADMSFELALAVRGKAVAAYQQMMQMQF